MLLTGYCIESHAPRARIWKQLTALGDIDTWSMLGNCVSTASPYLEPGATYLGEYGKSDKRTHASIQVTDLEIGELVTLRISTPLAEVLDRLELRDNWGGTILTYSVRATSSGFGPLATAWLQEHIHDSAAKLIAFAERTSR